APHRPNRPEPRMPRYRPHPCEAISYCNRRGASAGLGAPSTISFGQDRPVGIDPSQGTSLSACGFAEPVALPRHQAVIAPQETAHVVAKLAVPLLQVSPTKLPT